MASRSHGKRSSVLHDDLSPFMAPGYGISHEIEQITDPESGHEEQIEARVQQVEDQGHQEYGSDDLHHKEYRDATKKHPRECLEQPE